MSSNIPSIVKVLQPSKGKVGWTKTNKGEDVLVFPFHMMGCCGDDKMVRASHLFTNVTKLDKTFWGKLAKAIDRQAYCDWDWYSLQQNVIIPNEKHIRAVCDIKSDRVWERFAEDGMVFLNRWDRSDKDSDAEEDDEPIVLPCGKNCFEDIDVEY
jgi:hypothetical protein